jgi:hypothetical protein
MYLDRVQHRAKPSFLLPPSVLGQSDRLDTDREDGIIHAITTGCVGLMQSAPSRFLQNQQQDVFLPAGCQATARSGCVASRQGMTRHRQDRRLEPARSTYDHAAMVRFGLCCSNPSPPGKTALSSIEWS